MKKTAKIFSFVLAGAMAAAVTEAAVAAGVTAGERARPTPTAVVPRTRAAADAVARGE